MRYWVLFLLCLGAVISYVQRLGISTPVKEIQVSLNLEKDQIGFIMSAWYLGYALMQIPSGLVADRIGARLSMLFFSVGWSILTALTGLAWNFYSLLGIWMAMGMAMAGIFPCATKSISELFKDGNKAFASGMLAASMAFGAAISQFILSRLIEFFSWNVSFLLISLPGIIWGSAFFLLTKKAHEKKISEFPSPSSAVSNFNFNSIIKVFFDPTVILICSQQFFRAMGMVFFYTWFPTYLKEARQLSNLETGNIAMIVLFGSMIGGITGGIASDKILEKTGNRRLARQGIAVAGMGLCSLLTVISYLISDVTIAVAFFAIAAFFANFGGVSGYTVTMEYGGAKVATVFSLVNMCGNIGGTLFPFISGMVLANSGNWNTILFLFAGIFAVDAIIWCFIRPSKPHLE